MNKKAEKRIGNLLRTLGSTPRIRILLALGEGEACVCHLETALNYRQAYISQHLMALREMDLLTARRDGRFVFYSLRDPSLLDLLQTAAEVAGVALPARPQPVEDCICPSCASIVFGDVRESVS